MSTQLSTDILESIVDTLAPDDPNLRATKACSLVCHDFLAICRKRIFARIILNNPSVDPPPSLRIDWVQHGTTASFKRLLSFSPDLAQHVRELAVNLTAQDLKDTALVDIFKKINQLQALTLRCSRSSQSFLERIQFDWDNNPLRPGLLHLLHLPTIVSFNLLAIENFLVSDLIPCANLKQIRFSDLSISSAFPSESKPIIGSPIQPLSLFGGTKSASIFTEMYAMRCADGSPFFDFSGLTTLAYPMAESQDLEGLRHILSRCENLVNLSTRTDSRSFEPIFTNLSKMLTPSIHTLKRIDLLITFDDSKSPQKGQEDPFRGFIDALEGIENYNIIETLSIGVIILIDSTHGPLENWGRLDKLLTRPTWSKLRAVSLTVKTHHWFWDPSNPMDKTIQAFGETQFSGLSSHKSIVFNFRLVAQPL
ncbi:hypothetical protein BDN70DRAFT_929559 [Pholiota conissans]|uniref:Uncharacterized protein n=1 Tax=Pholiota conissans TaxID=109636 RepID=A0A9P5Z7W7_9AGAR|nr:hypothetical protein BDN70DRAFT_929559 [Pholiota conissans]